MFGWRIALLVVGLCFAAPGAAATLTFESVLAPEVVGATGSGSVSVVYDDVAHSLAITADWSGLSGGTTVAHIHCCVATPGTGTVGVAVTPGTLPGFPTGVTAGSYSVLLDLTLASTYTTAFLNGAGGGTTPGAEAALIAGLQAGTAYFNVHSSTFTGGEIRGFPALVPEPSLASLLLAATLGLAARRWRHAV